MKKLFYTFLGVAMSCSYSWAQEIEYTKLEDLTSKITNADFTAGTPVNAIIKTYAKDLTDAGLGAGGTELFGMQPVEGWTASAPTDNIMTTEENGINARACGVLSYVTEDETPSYGLGGEGNIPYTGEGGATCGLGVLAVWGATAQYTQEITLPAGAYLIEIPVCNTMGAGGMTNLNGFIAEDGTQYVSKTQSFPADAFNSTIDQIAFILEKETKGVISLGYISGGQGSASSPHLFYSNVSLYKIDPTPLIAEKIASAKESLLELINYGDQIGADTRDAQAVYDNAGATLEEVETAIAAQKAINESSLSDLSEFFINNPHFNQDDALPEGQGITTYDYDRSKNSVNYYGMQPVIGWTANFPAATIDDNPLDKNTGVNNGRACGIFGIGTTSWLGGSQFIVPKTMSDGSTLGNVLGFLTCWSATTQYTQNVTIPAGKYTLTISYYNTGGTNDVAKNLMGFIADDGTEYLSEVTSFKVGSWEKMTIAFELEESTSGKFSVGYTAANTGSGNMPHFFIDGISLNYVGETAIDPSLFALQAAVTSGEVLLDNSFNVTLKEKFNDAVEAGQALVGAVSSDKEANIAAKDAITLLVDEVNENIKAYEELYDFADVLSEKIEEMKGKTLFEDYCSYLESLSDQIGSEILEDYTWTTQQIKDAIASVPVKYNEALQKAFETIQAGGYTGEDLDITPLLSGLAYTYNESALSGSNVPDKEWVYGDASNFKTQYGTAEVWNQSPFKITRTLNDMPAGTYTITTRAFYRSSDNESNYETFNSDKKADLAFVWAGYSKSPLCNVAELAGIDDSFGSKLANELTIPNNQKEANYVFTNEKFDTYTVKSVKTVLPEAGDLSFGICSDQMSENSWVVWYSFEIKYNVVDNAVLQKDLAGLVEEAEEYLGEKNEVASVASASSLQNVIGTASDAVLSGAGLAEAWTALIAELDAFKANVAIYTEMADAYEKLSSAIEEYSATAETQAQTAATLLAAEFNSALENRNLSTDEIQSMLSKVREAIRNLKLPAGMDGATDTEPVPCTSLIENPSFETGDFTGWTYNTAASGDTKVASNADGYIVENADGSYVFNTWNSSAVDFYVTQTIDDLKPGTYELTALVASDKGNKITVSVNNDAVEAEMLEEKNIGTDVSVIFAVADGESAVIKVSSASWFKADNFRLQYFGTNSTKTPTAVEEVAAETEATTIYNISGVRQNSLQKGLNIVKNGNTVKKIYVK